MVDPDLTTYNMKVVLRPISFGNAPVTRGLLQVTGALFSTVMVALLLSCTSAAIPSDLRRAMPDPALTPQQVVRLQLDAFALNDEEDRGIEIAFRFASPENQAATGPLPRFAEMMRSEAYLPMLQPTSTDVLETQLRSGAARVPVVITDASGLRVAYLFVLTRSRTENCDGCWLTAAVTVLGLNEVPAPRSI